MNSDMPTAEFLVSLRRRDVRLWIDQDRLKCSAPADVLDAEMKTALASRKEEILAFLRQVDAVRSGPPAIIPLKPEGRRLPLFAIPGHNGDVFCYVALSRHLHADQPIYGVQPPGLDGTAPLGSVEELAAYEVAQIRTFQPHGPYLIAGYCAGGTVAFEVARQLTEQGHQVALLALFGSPSPGVYRWRAQAGFWVRNVFEKLMRHLRTLATAPLADGIEYVKEKMQRRREERRARAEALDDPVAVNRERVAAATIAGIRLYRPRHLAGQIDMFLPSATWDRSGNGLEEWKSLTDRVSEHVGPDGCEGDVMLLEPFVATMAELLRRRLDEVARSRDE